MTGQSSSGLAKGRRFERYEIREQIGQGGMGAVYRAVDSKLGRTVALKTVVAQHAGTQLTEPVRQRFLREALAISRIDHRNVVQVFDFGFADDGTPFLVMEFLRGRDLGSLVKASHDPLAIAYVADVALGVCAALRACHHANIVHRDLKPSNVFLADTDTGWEVKVLDFGVSKAAMIAQAEITEDGQIVGTPQYLSPEQVNGRVGPESDQYAVGVLLYVCLTKRLPFRDQHNVTLLRAIEAGRFEPPRSWRPDLPAGLEATILRAMATNPRDRFESIHALGQKLWEFASPLGRDQWKAFYFQTPPAAHAAKESMHAVPLVEALVRAGRPSEGPRAPGLPGGSVPAPRNFGTPPTMSAAPMRESKVMARKPHRKPQRLISTKLAAPTPDTDGELQALLRGGRRRVALFAALFAGLVLGGGIWFARSRAPSDAPETPSELTLPTPSAPSLPPPAASPPAVRPPETGRSPAPAAPAEGPTPPDAMARALSEGSRAPATKKRAPQPRPRPRIDSNGIGIPEN